MMKRDQFLDRMRTIAILWVLLVHVFYWLGFLSAGRMNTVRSWFLLEMPLFFFITGAGQALAKPRRWGEYVLRSYRRLLVPYWCYALLCLLLGLVLTHRVDAVAIIHWLIPADRQPSYLPYMTDALWFVPVYLLCVPVIPLLQRGKSRPWPVVALLVTLLLGFERLGWYYGQNVAFYSLWIFIGLHYPQLKQRYVEGRGRRWELLLVALLGIGILAVLCLLGVASADMQSNKLPPNGVFLLYSLAGMSILGLVLPGVVWFMNRLARLSVARWGMDTLSRYTLSVFLYQPFAFLLLNRMMVYSAGRGVGYKPLFALCLVLLIPLGVALAAVFGPLETLGRRKQK